MSLLATTPKVSDQSFTSTESINSFQPPLPNQRLKRNEFLKLYRPENSPQPRKKRESLRHHFLLLLRSQIFPKTPKLDRTETSGIYIYILITNCLFENKYLILNRNTFSGHFDKIKEWCSRRGFAQRVSQCGREEFPERVLQLLQETNLQRGRLKGLM